MEQLEREIRKEIDEMNTSVSLVDRLEASDTMDEERRDELLSSTRAVFESVNPNNVKNSLTDSQISIISKHDGYPDSSGHFYSMPTGKEDGGGGGHPDHGGAGRPSGPDVTATEPTSKDRLTSKDRKQAKSKAKHQKVVGGGEKEQQPAAPAPGPEAMGKGQTVGSASLANLLFAPGAGPGCTKRKKLPSTVVLGLIQLLLSVTLAALGGLVIARNASLAMAGTGLWCGAIAGIAGSLGLMNVKMAKTGFLAVNLICVASSTLGLALTGIGAVRDANLAQQDELIWGAVTAGTGLLVALAVHFLISVFSVYYSALKLCSRPSQKLQMIDNVMHTNSQAFMTQQKVEDYINSLHVEPGVKDMMYQTMLKRSFGSMYGEKHRVGDNYSTGTSQRVMLVPAGAGNGLPPMMPMYPPVQSSPPGNSSMIYPPNLMPPGVPQYQPYPESALMEAQISRTNRKRSTMRMNNERNGADIERPRRKSDSDLEKTFTYTGLDRDIADSYLAKEEEKLSSSIVSNSGHHPSLPHTYHHDLMLIDHRTNFERYNDIHM
ncbi:AGAP000247-PA-like protein [Anopheles sinensis]|uniref:AGAP000247-PA-like protein n=1 Tax=Anopheles sinensis TaxID=74873 RepID=A0A084VJ44_ANOSI|nr:AGAP000247-PA-like protein [Anopheles sinensis]